MYVGFLSLSQKGAIILFVLIFDIIFLLLIREIKKKKLDKVDNRDYINTKSNAHKYNYEVMNQLAKYKEYVNNSNKLKGITRKNRSHNEF